MEINIENWREFELKKYFDINTSESFNIIELDVSTTKDDEYKYEFIGRSNENYGVQGYVKKLGSEANNIGNITISQVGTIVAQYRTNDYYTSQNMFNLTPKIEMDKHTAFFITTVLNKMLKKYTGYSEYPTLKSLNKETIQLPAIYNQEKEEYEPDWNYMEAFIKELKEENKRKLAFMQEIKPADDEIDINDWHEFEIGKLFKKTSAGLKNQKSFKKEIHVSETENNEFNLPLVNAKDGNNGIMYYGKKEEWDYVSMSIDIVSDGAVSTGNVYPQIDDTSVLYNAYLIKLKDKYIEGESKECLIFLSTIMQKEIKAKYGYENKATWGKVAKEKILLPAIYNSEKEEYKPDWEYMENFITNLQKETKNQLRRLKQKNE